MPQWTNQTQTWITRHPFVLFVALYAGLAVIALVAWEVLPAALQQGIGALTNDAGLGMVEQSLSRAASRLPPPTAPMWSIATVAMGSGGMLSLPVAWLYTITRRKRGYNQSVVHTLILLPVIVAGVVVLVKYSLALAFSLAGIVAAVRFRNTLEDSKDAVYIFVATSIGIAAGVELSVAATLSFVFNLVTLLLFRSDFGRTPGRLEGEMAEERMQRALATANRTSQFVARLDEEVLQSMAPEQLTALADRAWQRRREADDSARDCVLVVQSTDVARTRQALDVVLEKCAKKWRLRSAETGISGEQVLTFEVRLRKAVAPATLLDEVRNTGDAGVLDAELQ